MLRKKSKPVIGILAGSLAPSKKHGLVNDFVSKALLPPKIQLANGIKSFDLGGVGLGIVAALEKSSEIATDKALFGRNLCRYGANPVIPAKNSSRIRRDLVEMEMGSGEYRTPFRIRNSVKNNKRASVFDISPARSEEISGIPATDFLNSCNMCRKNLQGIDIFIYRGEKAFCSAECRYSVIAMDENQEKCSREAAVLMDVSASPLTNGPIFTDGIIAT